MNIDIEECKRNNNIWEVFALIRSSTRMYYDASRSLFPTNIQGRNKCAKS